MKLENKLKKYLWSWTNLNECWFATNIDIICSALSLLTTFTHFQSWVVQSGQSRPNNCSGPRLVRVESVRSWTVAEPSLNDFDQTRFKLYLTMSIICSVNTDINGRWSWVKCYCMYWKRSRKQTILLTHAERTPSPSKRYGPVQFIKSLHWPTIFRILASSLISHTIIFEWSFSLTVFSQSEAYQIN